jgi:histone-lysine N-methyltransferase SETD2
MVRSTDTHTKLALCKILRDADKPCKRLFLDYHGLKILHGWMNDLGSDSVGDLNLKLAIVENLASLAIPHRTMLNESKVWGSVCRWAGAAASEESSRAESPSVANGGWSKLGSEASTPTPSTSSATATPSAEPTQTSDDR